MKLVVFFHSFNSLVSKVGRRLRNWRPFNQHIMGKWPSRITNELCAKKAERDRDYLLAIEYYQIALKYKNGGHSDEYVKKQIEKLKGLQKKKINRLVK